MVFTGTNTGCFPEDPSEFYAYDASNLTRLQTFPLPDCSTSGVTVLDGWVYVGYGVFGGTGGVRAYRIQ